MADLKFYLTSPEPNVTQPFAAQSLGGFASLTEYSVNALLTEPLDHINQNVLISNNLGTIQAVLIDDEIIFVDSSQVFGAYGDELLTVQRGQYATSPKFHIIGDTVYAQNTGNLFNNSLSLSGTQYRCIAIKNTSSSDVLYNVQIYIKNGGQNPNSIIQIALEVPLSGVFYGSATLSTSISITDSSIQNVYPDNTFVGQLLVVDDPLSVDYNIARPIASFDGPSGTFTFVNSMAFPLETNANFRVEQPSSQNIVTGRVSPVFNTGNVSDLSTALGVSNAISINFSGSRINGSSLLPNEVVYLWIERDVSNNSDTYVNNGLVFTVNYKTTS